MSVCVCVHVVILEAVIHIGMVIPDADLKYKTQVECTHIKGRQQEHVIQYTQLVVPV